MSNNGQAGLRERLDAGEFIVAPGVYDLISARLADRYDFAALYMTGYGVTASNLGLPDAGLASYTQMLDRVATIAAGVAKPLIADADTGYGGLLNVDHTVRGYEQAGAAAIQIEDQVFPKKCGHPPGREVIACEDMVKKIEVAVAARASRDLLIVARTDARAVNGLDDAISRGRAYADAGADLIFIEAPRSIDENLAHCSRGHGHEVLSPFQGATATRESQIALVHEGRRSQRLVRREEAPTLASRQTS